MRRGNSKSRSSRNRALILLLGGLLLCQPGCDGGVVTVPAAAGATAVGGGILYVIGQVVGLKRDTVDLEIKKAELQRLTGRR